MMKKRTTPKKSVRSNIKSKLSNAISKNSKQTSNATYSGMKRKRNKRLSKKNKMILNVALVCVILFVVLFIAGAAYIVIKAPAFDPNNLKFTSMSELYDSKGNVFAKLGDENRTEISYDDLPEVLIDAIVATEDSKFFEHNGFDLARFSVATAKQLIGRGGGGASTLTMQIVKNNYTSTVSKGLAGITRKFTDIYLSVFKVEKKYTKKEILEFYVNDSYLGNGAYGVEQASQNYFGKSVSELNLAEASFIAGLFQAPAGYDPYNYPDKAENRRLTVLKLMKRHGYITDEELAIASSKNISTLVVKTKVNSSYSEYQGYIDTVVDELNNEYGINPYTTPLKVYTALNRDKQDFVNKVMNGEAWTWENSKAQSGVVMTESATGEVIAVGAGRNKNVQRSYNFATMTNKQIGSTAKPIFDYGPAIEYLGYGTVNYVDDSPTTYSDNTPISNSDGSYKGILPLYQALGYSRNIPALKIFQTVVKQAGNSKILEFASSLGLSPEVCSKGYIYNRTKKLCINVSDGSTAKPTSVHEAHAIGSFTGEDEKGGSRNSPMTMAGAYGAFSNGGYYVKPHTIKKFVYKETEETTVAESQEQFKKKQVMDKATAWMISYSLHWSATEGMAKTAANISGVDVAAKTGTTNFDKETIKKYGLSSRALNDLWVCGYSSKYTLTMWYGYDKIYKDAYSNQSTSWRTRDSFYKNLAENLFDKDGSTFTKPDNVVEVAVIKNSMPLKAANEYTPDSMKVIGYFKKGTEPKGTANVTENTLSSVSNLKAKVNGTSVTLTWNGISANDLLKIDSDDSYGNVGYDIYVKNGNNGKETFVATTTSTSYTHTTNYENPVYVVYTAFSNYKNNKSKGVSVSATIKTDFEVKISNSTVNLNEPFTDNKPIIVLHNSVDVTDSSKIEVIENNVDTSVAGDYTIKYRITYSGASKEVSRTVTVLEG